MTKEVIVYGRSEPPCPFCDIAKNNLDLKGIIYTYKDIVEECYYTEFNELRLRSVPAIFVDGVFKKGADQLNETIEEILFNE